DLERMELSEEADQVLQRAAEAGAQVVHQRTLWLWGSTRESEHHHITVHSGISAAIASVRIGYRTTHLISETFLPDLAPLTRGLFFYRAVDAQRAQDRWAVLGQCLDGGAADIPRLPVTQLCLHKWSVAKKSLGIEFVRLACGGTVFLPLEGLLMIADSISQGGSP